MIEWIKEHKEFNTIYSLWVYNAYSIEHYPSVTKIDKDKGYSINNMQLMGWRDKLDKDHVRTVENEEIRRLKRISDNKAIRDEHIESLLSRTHKICTKCNQDKPTDEYHNDSNSLDKLSRECKSCNYKSQLEFIRTKNGTAYRIYKKQLQKSKPREHEEPQYNLEELKEWLFNQEIFHKIFNEWEQSGYDTMMCVSCDRIDRHKGYSFDNIVVGTWQDNLDRWHKHRL